MLMLGLIELINLGYNLIILEKDIIITTPLWQSIHFLI